MVAKKSIFDEDVDKLKSRLRRLEKRRLDGRPTPEAIAVDVATLEMLIEDHEDLKRKEAN